MEMMDFLHTVGDDFLSIIRDVLPVVAVQQYPTQMVVVLTEAAVVQSAKLRLILLEGSQ